MASVSQKFSIDNLVNNSLSSSLSSNLSSLSFSSGITTYTSSSIGGLLANDKATSMSPLLAQFLREAGETVAINPLCFFSGTNSNPSTKPVFNNNCTNKSANKFSQEGDDVEMEFSHEASSESPTSPTPSDDCREHGTSLSTGFMGSPLSSTTFENIQKSPKSKIFSNNKVNENQPIRQNLRYEQIILPHIQMICGSAESNCQKTVIDTDCNDENGNSIQIANSEKNLLNDWLEFVKNSFFTFPCKNQDKFLNFINTLLTIYSPGWIRFQICAQIGRPFHSVLFLMNKADDLASEKPLQNDTLVHGNMFFFQQMQKTKRNRTAFSTQQLYQLERAFCANHYVIGNERKNLADCLNLSETQVKVWFQNRRTKQKRVESGPHAAI